MTNLTPTARIEDNADGITVWTVWAGVDRPETGGVRLARSPAGRALAARLKTAIEAGAVHLNPTVKTDINGKTYVAASCEVIGRRLNADLKRLGF